MTSIARRAQENDSVAGWRALSIAGLSALVGATAVAVSVLLSPPRSEEHEVRGPALASTTMPEQTLIESTARGVRLREAERAKLDRYEWVDRDAGIVRIPIERAIELEAEPRP